MKKEEFKNYKFVSPINFGIFYNSETVTYISVTHMFEDGAIQYGTKVIYGRYWDLVEFFIDHCTKNHQPDTEFWADSEKVEQAWKDFSKLDIKDKNKAFELSEKYDIILAGYQEYGAMYRHLFERI